jgi:large conductance mechanosensitive channel
MDPLKKVTTLEPAKKAFSLFEEFKAFAFKGNVVDLAVGVVIGAAFGKIISSFVDNLLMPALGLLLPGDRGYEGWVIQVEGKVIPYGKFLGDIVNFLIVAFALFIFASKFLGWLMRARKEEMAAAPPLTKDQQLLTEIRDLLKNRPTEAPPPASLPAST